MTVRGRRRGAPASRVPGGQPQHFWVTAQTPPETIFCSLLFFPGGRTQQHGDVLGRTVGLSAGKAFLRAHPHHGRAPLNSPTAQCAQEDPATSQSQRWPQHSPSGLRRQAPAARSPAFLGGEQAGHRAGQGPRNEDSRWSVAQHAALGRASTAACSPVPAGGAQHTAAPGTPSVSPRFLCIHQPKSMTCPGSLPRGALFGEPHLREEAGAQVVRAWGGTASPHPLEPCDLHLGRRQREVESHS